MSLALALITASALAAEPAGLEHTVTLGPSIQLNSKFTEHYGTNFHYAIGRDGWAGTLTLQNHWVRREHPLNRDLLFVRSAIQSSSTTLIPWALIGGLRLSPVRGHLGEYGVDLEGMVEVGAGYGARSHLVRVGTLREAELPLNGRVTGSGAFGLRARFADGVALSLELRSLFGIASAARVHGCDEWDVSAMDSQLRTGRRAEEAHVSNTCDVGAFAEPADVPAALGLVVDPSSDVLFILSANVGISATF